MSKKTLYFDSYCGYVVSVIAENGKIIEFNFEKRDKGSIIGNVYKGVVESVLPGMQAAFVNCGLERNCFVSAEDAFDAEKYDAHERGAICFPELHEGDEILVQVIKAPVGKKGARVTLHPSFVGKALIYMPKTPFMGISRKIADEELRKNLIFSISKLKDDNEGLIVRTAAPYVNRKQLEVELTYLRSLYSKIKKDFETAERGALLYSDDVLPIRVLRDTLSYDIEKIIVGSKRTESLVNNIINMYPPSNRRPVILHDTGRDMLDEYGLSEQIIAISSPYAQLENGAYLVIEKTEALTVIDVNTGKFIGDDSLEQTVYYTNILAAREIARQVRLRNIGGIVVVDFIDMQNPAHRKSLVEELERALKSDKSKCVVSPMSRFGLVEFTRKRVGINPTSLMVQQCRHCKGTGAVKTYSMTMFVMRAKLLNLVADGNKIIRVDMGSELLERLSEREEILTDLKERCGEVRIYAVAHKSYNEDQVYYRCEGEDNFNIPENAVRLV